jgi:hypothetical protein
LKFSTVDDGEMLNGKIGTSSFVYSGIRPDKLDATEYTLVTVVRDKSGSVDAFSGDLVDMLNAVKDACGKSPRAENLLFRLVDFNQVVEEVHGFVPLNTLGKYTASQFRCGGMTALFDSTFSAIGGASAYAKTLVDQDFSVNGIIFIITDGADNSSINTPDSVKKEIEKVLAEEVMDSLSVVLIGINAKDCKDFLQNFVARGSLTQYVEVADASPQRLAKLAGFVSKSISSTSQNIGTGTSGVVPQSLSF